MQPPNPMAPIGSARKLSRLRETLAFPIRAYRRSLQIDPFYTPAYERLKSLGAI